MQKDRRWDYRTKDWIFHSIGIGVVTLSIIYTIFRELTIWVLFFTLFSLFINVVWCSYVNTLTRNHNLYVIEKEYGVEDETRRINDNTKKKR